CTRSGLGQAMDYW
nr:immunoglobulin heavy chain junction region [Mus musculus]